jgi:hypothetical protein
MEAYITTMWAFNWDDVRAAALDFLIDWYIYLRRFLVLWDGWFQAADALPDDTDSPFDFEHRNIAVNIRSAFSSSGQYEDPTTSDRLLKIWRAPLGSAFVPWAFGEKLSLTLQVSNKETQSSATLICNVDSDYCVTFSHPRVTGPEECNCSKKRDAGSVHYSVLVELVLGRRGCEQFKGTIWGDNVAMLDKHNPTNKPLATAEYRNVVTTI